jgi:hypothetical protein
MYEIYKIDLNSDLPDIKEELKSHLSFVNDFRDIRFPKELQSEIKGSNHRENYEHFEAHISVVEATPEDLVFVNSSALPHLKALQTQIQKSLKELKPNSLINVEDIQKATKWLNIQKLLIDMIQFLEGFGKSNTDVKIKNEMLSKIYNRNLGNLVYIPDDWVALLERNRFDPNDINNFNSLTASEYMKYILHEGIGYKELDEGQYVSFDALELYKKQTPINFDDMVKIAERTCKVRREVRKKYKPDNLN